MIRIINNVMSHEKWPFAVAVLALILTLPGLLGGFSAGDFIHKAAFFNGHFKTEGSFFGGFSFASGDEAHNRALMESGMLPWWTHPELKINFWRPLSELSHGVDFALWPNTPWLMHLHSSLWYFALVLVAALFYGCISNNKRVAVLSGLLFAVAGVHATTVGWIANRNALIAGVFGLLTLLMHNGWRKRGGVKYPAGAIFSLICSLMSAEAGVATVAYLFSYMLFMESKQQLRSRLVTLLPYVLVVLVWKGFYDYLGFGAYGSGSYINPTDDMALFVGAVAERAPIFLLAQFFVLPASLHMFMPEYFVNPLWIISVTILLAVGLILTPLLIKSNVGRFYLLGTLLAVIPICAGNIDERSLVFVSLGGCALVGFLIDKLIASFTESCDLTGIQKGTIITLTVPNLVLAPLLLVIGINGFAYFTHTFTDPLSRIPVTGELKDAKVFLVNPPAPQFNMYARTIYHHEDQAGPATIQSLATGSGRMTVTREGNSLMIELEKGYIRHYDSMFRSPEEPFKVGDSVELSMMTASVLSTTEDLRPRKVVFNFADEISTQKMQFFMWDGYEYKKFNMPETGQSVVLKPNHPVSIVLNTLGI